jgi:hypothetical protein
MREINLYNGFGIRAQPGEEIRYLEIRSSIQQANKNRSEVILSTLVIEGLLDTLISKKIAPSTKDAEAFLSGYLLKSDIITFASKRKLALQIIRGDSLLDPDDIESFSTLLRDIMTWRNAFAHGEIVQIGSDTCIEYAQVGPQKIVLSDAYWTKVESTFSKVFSLFLLIDHKWNATA